METAETLRRKIGGAKELLSVVKTMKALAAVGIRQIEKAVHSLAAYDRTVQQGLQMVVHRAPEVLAPPSPARSGRSLAVVLGSDQGLVGRFNEMVAGYARDQMEWWGLSEQPWTIWAVGLRAATQLERLDCRVSERFAAPASINSIQSVVQEILPRMEDWRSPDKNEPVFLIFNRTASGSFIQPHRIPLLPLDREWLRSLALKKWPHRVLPTFTMGLGPLLAALVRQHLSVTLYRTVAQSLAAENAGRLAAMQVAEKNISERLEELQAAFHQQRQSAITEELLDVISGFEALTGDTRPEDPRSREDQNQIGFGS
jgi:F-type H+-transporting ATPase subunit gamma